MIRYSEQLIDQTDIDAVVSALNSPFLTQGPKIEEFEENFSSFVGSDSSVAVCNATAALHLAYLSLGISKGDTVWTVGNTFVATSSAALYCGAQVDFVDICLSSYNICTKSLEEKLLNAEVKPKVLTVVHFAGRPCPMKEIKQLCDTYNIKIIEDASHAVGARYMGLPIGSCKYSDICIFSFHPVKIITTGEGGMICSNDKNIISITKKLRSHGIERSTTKHWYPTQEVVGFNYRMTEIQAALGINQLRKLPEYQLKRDEICRHYFEALSDLNITLPLKDNDEYYSAKHLYVVLLCGKTEEYRNSLLQTLINNGVGANLHYYPTYRFKNFQRSKDNFPNNECYFKTALTIPCSITMGNNDVEKVVNEIKICLA
ncbi:UDP-4-amino-4,6-dideoxy-N-acetyl-beta-L-altrosamine transaminase [Amylibacter sp.]|nr:UDP-4-amino-4,6-dideoxy-N-acetyl-beta-L-altrosamine transaminase [Amylibacter sp.]